MFQRIIVLGALSIFIIWALSACLGSTKGGPDLIAEKPFGIQGPEGFCTISEEDAGNLLVHVRNIGNKNIFRHSTVLVVFSPGGVREAYIPPLGYGAYANAVVEMPTGWPDPGGTFEVTVDANNNLDETDETNNVYMGKCPGLNATPNP